MKNKSTIIRVLMVLCIMLLCILVAVSCGKENEQNKPVDRPDDVDRADDLPSDLDFDSEQVNIFYWGANFVVNELTADGSTGDIVDLAIDERNTTVEERLNIKLNYIQGENPAEVFMPVVRDEVMSGSTDYDIILGPQCTSGEVAAAGAFRDLQNAEYIDYSKPYWSDDYIQALSVNEKKFMIGGDVSLTTTAWTSMMIFFLEEYENTFGAPENLYNLVLEGDGSTGGWTTDTFADYCRQSYVDLNGNGLRDNGDQYGMDLTGTSSTTDRYMLSSGINLTVRDESNVPHLNIKSSQVINYFEKFYNLCYDNVGVLMNNADFSDDIEINSIFAGVGMDALVSLRGEERDFGVIPMPKADEAMTQYKSWLSDNTVIAAVPITEVDDRMGLCGATLECFASENYRLLLPAYYEMALKEKFTRDENSKKMLDIIHDGETTDFAVSYSQSLSGIGGMFRQLIGYNEPNLVSWYEARESQTLAKMQTLFDAFEQHTVNPIIPDSQTANTVDPTDTEEDIADNQISTNWKVFGSKYRASQVLVRPDMSDKFAYVINDNDEIEVRSPSMKAVGGYNPTAAIMSKTTVPLAPLSVEFHTDEGFTYTRSPDGYSSAVSFVWSDKPMEALPNYLDGIGTNGLRACVPDDAFALVVSFLGTTETSGDVANLMYIIMFDGTGTAPETDNRTGYRWTNWIETNVAEPILIEIREDETLGYIVNLNGVDYTSGMRGSETLDIDLTPLKDKASSGFIGFGAESAGDDSYSNFTVSKINGKNAGSYFD